MTTLAQRLARPEVLALEPFDIAAQANWAFGSDAFGARIAIHSDWSSVSPASAMPDASARSLPNTCVVLYPVGRLPSLNSV